MFAYVVGSVCTIVASMDKKSSEHHELMDTLNAMARELSLGEDLQRRCRDYFRYRHSSTNMDDWRVMLEIMSPRLRGEVAMMQCGPWINNVPFFRGAPETFIVDVALKLKSVTFPQGEEIVRAGAISTRLYIVERGVVGGKGRVFTSGKTFGEEVLNGGAPTAFTARAMTYCDVFSLPGTVIERIASAFPVMQRRLRTAGCRGMMKDALIALDHAWGQVARGHATSPDVPEALGEDASLADEAVKRRTDKVFAFALSLAAREGGGGGGGPVVGGKPSLPSDSGARFKKRPNAEGSFRVRRPRGAEDPGEKAAEEGMSADSAKILRALREMESNLEERIVALEQRPHK